MDEGREEIKVARGWVKRMGEKAKGIRTYNWGLKVSEER